MSTAMASFGRSLKPPSYISSMAARRPPMSGRSMSNNSIRDVSSDSCPSSPGPALSPGEFRHDDIVFSPRLSPSNPSAELHTREPSPGLYGGHLIPASGRVTSHPYKHSSDSPFFEPSQTPSSASSRPIAIQRPASKSQAVDGTPGRTPPAPLSARGDLPGGYFPLHEEQNRTYHPHPFHLDATKARKRSIQIAHRESQSPDTLPKLSKTTESGYFSATSVSPVMARSSTLKIPDSGSRLRSTPSSPGSPSSRTTTPVAAYNPGPCSENPLPMGKYYPSNYEQRKADKYGRPVPSPSTSFASGISAGSPSSHDSSMSGYHRYESDAKRRIQQYQRDMIAQATLALNNGSLSPAAMQSLRSIGFASISSSNPSKPRLQPLGSPGPVTPMELGGSDGYLSARGSADDMQAEEIARVMRAEEERKRREGASSPIVGLGPSTC